MNSLHSLLEKYDTVLLDMDGVITSEAIYWDAAALTVWEHLASRRYFGTEDIVPADAMEKVAKLRKEIFCDDETIRLVKSRGVNNNWDLAWLVIGIALSEKTRDFTEILEILKQMPETAVDLFSAMAKMLEEKAGFSAEDAAHHGHLWTKVQYSFQEWFLGSAEFPKYWDSPMLQEGKSGLSFREEPLVSKEPLLKLLSAMGQKLRLGVGTGRPRVEAETPLKNWGAWEAFSPDAFVTYGEVLAAQNAHPGLALTKPHPFMFLKGALGSAATDNDIIGGTFDSAPCKKTLVIGDAACDMIAAKAAGCDFLAVLTGIEGSAARDFFEKEGADYVLDNILELLI